jgi:hypothetical protein
MTSHSPLGPLTGENDARDDCCQQRRKRCRFPSFESARCRRSGRRRNSSGRDDRCGRCCGGCASATADKTSGVSRYHICAKTTTHLIVAVLVGATVAGRPTVVVALIDAVMRRMDSTDSLVNPHSVFNALAANGKSSSCETRSLAVIDTESDGGKRLTEQVVFAQSTNKARMGVSLQMQGVSKISHYSGVSDIEESRQTRTYCALISTYV